MRNLLYAGLLLGACGGGSGEGSGTDAAPIEIDATPIESCESHSLPRELGFEVEGETRRTLLAGPTALPDAPLPLVLNFHGYSDSPEQQEDFSLMSDAALAGNYLVAYPEGTGLLKGWNAGACCGTAASSGVDDVAFTEALIEEISAIACVDPSRIYAIGYSNGGFLSHRLACELSDKISGIASVAGVGGFSDCDPQRSIPVLQIHGDADVVVPYQGNLGLGFESVDETMEGWRLRKGCSDAPPVSTFAQGDASCLEWSECDTPLKLCTIEGGGHTWPGGTAPITRGKVSSDLDANQAIMDFFAQ